MEAEDDVVTRGPRRGPKPPIRATSEGAPREPFHVFGRTRGQDSGYPLLVNRQIYGRATNSRSVIRRIKLARSRFPSTAHTAFANQIDEYVP